MLLEALAATVLTTLPASITESSGVATSSTSDDWFFTHEDSGAEGDVHVVGTDGRLLGTLSLGVQSRDWEDMARAGGHLYLADIGDNSAARDHGILVHRVAEPTTPGDAVTPPDASFRLRYEDGPRDAETLLVHPTTGRLHVVTKGLLGRPRVYAAPEQLRPDSPNVLEHVADVEVERTGTPGGPGIGPTANVLVTAGDISPDGTKLALRTYTDLYEWWLADDVAAAVRAEPVVTALPPTTQGEGLAYTRDGTALLATTEGEGAPVHRVPSALTGPPQAPRDERSWLLPAGLLSATALLAVAALRSRRRRRPAEPGPGRVGQRRSNAPGGRPRQRG